MNKHTNGVIASNELRENISETVYDFLSEDERFYGKRDGTESITAVPERLIKELVSIANQQRADAVKGFAEWLDRKEKRGFEDPVRLIQAREYLKEQNI